MKLKCIKCGTRFKDRKDEEDTEYQSKCCWNCRFVIKCFSLSIESFGINNMIGSRINRDIILNFDDLKIIKRRKV